MKKLKITYHAIWQRIQSLNWIDLVGIIIFLGILSTAFFFFLRKSDYAYITLRVSQTDNLNTYIGQPPVWYIQQIQPGLQETDGLGRSSVIVERVHRFVSSDANQDLYVDLKIKSVYNSRTKQYSYNGVPLLIGSFQSFKLQNVQLTGSIVSVRGRTDQTETKTFIVKGFLDATQNDNQATVANTVVDGVRNYYADAIQKGMTITDVDGQVVTEVLDVRKTQGKRSFVSGSSFISVADPDRTKVEVSLRVKGTKINDAYYYKNETPLLLGVPLYLTFPKFNFTVTVTSFQEESS